MKKSIFFLIATSLSVIAFSQETGETYKKRVLENAEIEFLVSGYNQDGGNSAVSGGIGSENLQDLASNIVISIPLSASDVLTIDTGMSAYSSASSSNINPFNNSGASSGDDDDDDDDDRIAAPTTGPVGTPWQASSGASKSDVLTAASISFAHSSDSRKFMWGLDTHFSLEYDYTSIGFGGNVSVLFNGTNSEISLKANAYLDTWKPIYPTELREYEKYGNNFLIDGHFQGVTVYNQDGVATSLYKPTLFQTLNDPKRNSYSASLGFSQVLTPNIQFSLFMDVVMQDGLLSTPYHRMYFADKVNYFIGLPEYITNYQSTSNKGVYQLADDIEQLPNKRYKLPVGARVNFYLNERVALRTYYRYYWDDWEITSHTANIELPVKISDKFTVSPLYRYYTQTASKYFAAFDTHVSTEEYYTSDYDLSAFDAHQYGLALGYTDIFTKMKIWKIGLKNIDFRYNHYSRSSGLEADIATLGFKFVVQ